MRVLAALDRLNAAHPWSHNDAFTGLVLRHARAVRRHGGTTAVDVGCGTGNLLLSLSEVFPQVIGLEPDPETAAAAARRFSGSAVLVEERRFGSEPHQAYDLIVFVASLHHMPLRPALLAARAALRPGGRVVIVGVAGESPGDALRSGISLVLNPLIGLVRHPTRATQPPAHMRAPTSAADQTFDEIRGIADEALPGVRMRRRLFWRYTATWTAPA
jgi:SAM-dependent methyltransferase